MAKELKILMVDDHPIILEGYRNILQDNRSSSVIFHIHTAGSCDEANTKINESIEGEAYDMVFLDIGLPPSADKKFLSGEDLGRKIREFSPETKLLVLTMFAENVRLLAILRSLHPEAFMIKSDVTPKDFLEAFDKVLEGKTYNSQTVQDLMRKQIINDLDLDKTDRDILYHLAQGLKNKEIPKVVPVSLTVLEKRKKAMREAFALHDLRDITLINKARELGFI